MANFFQSIDTSQSKILIPHPLNDIKEEITLYLKNEEYHPVYVDITDSLNKVNKFQLEAYRKEYSKSVRAGKERIF